MIFDMYINKSSYKSIIEKLHKLGIPSPTGKKRWIMGTIEQMAQNEKYAGHMSLSKTFIHNSTRIRSSKLTKQGNMIMNHHVSMISEAVFNQTQTLRQSRSKNTRDEYIPLVDKVTPYYQFVYSKVNERYLKLLSKDQKINMKFLPYYCYNNQKTNRVHINVKNFFTLLNDALNKLSKLVNKDSSIFIDIVSKAILRRDNDLAVTPYDKLNLLNQKVSLLEG